MIFLGLGSNLPSRYGDRFANINLAISHLGVHGIQIINKSSFYETYSYPNKEYPKFINVVISIKTDLSIVEANSRHTHTHNLFLSRFLLRVYRGT